MKRFLSVLQAIFLCIPLIGAAQYHSRLSGPAWADSVFNSLTEDERIAQLMVIRAHSNLGSDHVAKVTEEIRKYDVGALCFFQGGPVRQANLTNYYQDIAKTPLMITMDGEWGLGMRLDSLIKFPYQLTLGAIADSQLVYRMGKAVGQQFRRLGVQVNYAPVVDINNNPQNPVIGYRSFGEDKNKVAGYGVAYMEGMQQAGIMACAKHFPGHGDVDVDSHLDLPVINKSMDQLENTELMPFRALFNAGVGSVMIAHLAVPAIDNTPNKATSISKKNVTGLLRNELGYKGLTFTDALEMKGVAKYFPNGTISVEALAAGNDMLCLPASVPESIEAIKKAIREKKLNQNDINKRVKKVLLAKYELGLNQRTPINTEYLLPELNANTNRIRYEVATNAITLLRNDDLYFPVTEAGKIAYIGIGSTDLNNFGRRMQEDLGADTFLFSYKATAADAQRILESIRTKEYTAIVIGVHEYSLRPANNYQISNEAVQLVNELQTYNTATFVFGNVLAISNFCTAKNLVACYQDDDITQHAAADMVEGKLLAKGKLPVSVCSFKYGDGIAQQPNPAKKAVGNDKLMAIDSIVNDAIAQKAFPGCVVLALHKGEVIYYKSFGHYQYEEDSHPTELESIFDLASVTKVSATTISIMKLYEEGRIGLENTLGDYLPWVRGTNKAKLTIHDVLLHQAGLVAYIPFYKEIANTSTGELKPGVFSDTLVPGYTVKVADSLYLRDDWEDTLFKRILASPVGPRNKYVYSDNDFIFLGKIVEQLTGMTLDKYVQQHFYSRLGMATTGFKPLERFPADRIVPTELDKYFRHQLLQGYVHDEGSALFGGVAGHAGLFSDAYDLAILYQMLLNGGEFNGQRFFKPETVQYFAAYHSQISRRGLGFDKPEKDNATRTEPYPCANASSATFGHTGFTGTCVWVDPEAQLVYIFLSNRVYPTSDNPKLLRMNIRGKVQDVLYKAVIE